jgi:hypothetical protein
LLLDINDEEGLELLFKELILIFEENEFLGFMSTYYYYDLKYDL